MPTTDTDVRAHYTERLAARKTKLERFEEQSRQFWRWRRIIFVAGAILLLLSINGTLSYWWLPAPVVVFIALMAAHDRVHDALKNASRSVAFYQRGLARLADAWTGQGEAGARFANKTHPYAEDLDLFGHGSLFELLSTARTAAGEQRLAMWLLAPAAIDEILARQTAIVELRPKIDLREDLALLGANARAAVDSETLVKWATAPAIHFSPALRLIALALGLTATVAVVAWFVFGWVWLALAAIMLEGIFLFVTRSRIGQVISEIERPSRDLRLLGSILARLEREPFSAARLASLRAALDTQGVPASRQIARLYLLIDILNSTKNLFFAPLAFVLLIPAQLAFAIEHWRQTTGQAVSRWVDAIGDFEALASLACYSAEHPQDPFPELVTDETCFDSQGLAHPLIPGARSVRNDVKLGNQARLLIVSGSNMSGKSTLLRTVGINAVLAFAGAPVRASAMRVSRLAIGASIHILDSLQEGSSRFYAEITRLRQLVDLTNGDIPLLFLLDEILSGTNSHDRQIGAAAVVKALIEQGAIGLITTHDLALTRIADQLSNLCGQRTFC